MDKQTGFAQLQKIDSDLFNLLSKGNILSTNFDYNKTKEKITEYVHLLYDFRGTFQDLNLLKIGLHYYDPNFLLNRLEFAQNENLLFLKNVNKVKHTDHKSQHKDIHSFKWSTHDVEIDIEIQQITIEKTKNFFFKKDSFITIKLILRSNVHVDVRIEALERSSEDFNTDISLNDVNKEINIVLKPNAFKSGNTYVKVSIPRFDLSKGIKFEYNPKKKQGHFYPFSDYTKIRKKEQSQDYQRKKLENRSRGREVFQQKKLDRKNKKRRMDV